MSNYITLLGADEIRSAGGQIEEAASNMIRAANILDQAIDNQREMLNNFLSCLKALLNGEEKTDG